MAGKSGRGEGVRSRFLKDPHADTQVTGNPDSEVLRRKTIKAVLGAVRDEGNLAADKACNPKTLLGSSVRA